MLDRAEIVHQAFMARVVSRDFPPGRAGMGEILPSMAVEIYYAACLSRALDRTARAMQSVGQGYYTIGSSGHEGLAGLAMALRPTDMAFLHYRDAAFQIARSRQLPGQTITWDMLVSFAASSEDPISGGRHKVLGSRALFIPPQTSTIASHLPKAVGAAYSIGSARRYDPEHRVLPADSIVVCTFGDASANHSTAQGAINTAGWTTYQSAPLPLLFICEDNGIGISTKTPKGWIRSSMERRPGIKYFSADGLDIYETYRVASEAATYVRTRRKPAFLHLRMVRLYGHAGADVALSYLSRAEIEADEANDPLLHMVRQLAGPGILSPEEALAIYQGTCERVERVAARAVERPKLRTRAEVMASLIPPKRACRPLNGASDEAREAAFGSDLRQFDTPQPMSRIINWTLTDLMLDHSEIVLVGEDVGRKGGVYGVTQKLQNRFGPARVIDTLLDEQSILGLAIGMAHNGFIPVPEIQFLAYLHNAEDQIRGEAATLSFFSNGKFTNPMVVRIAGLGYQKGFGGHFHNDNSVAVLRDIPGIILACPSNGADAAMMLRECLRLAREEQRVVIFLEPIALYSVRDLHEEKDGAWMTTYPDRSRTIRIGEVGIEGTGTDLAIVSFANGYYLSCQAARRLEEKGHKVRVIDLRWLSPLPEEALLSAIAECATVLIVDETRESGGVSEGLIALLSGKVSAPVRRIASADSFIATGPAYAVTMPSADDIFWAAKRIMEETK